MKQEKWIYKVCFIDNLEETLNTINTNKLLANVLNLDGYFLIVWEE